MNTMPPSVKFSPRRRVDQWDAPTLTEWQVNDQYATCAEAKDAGEDDTIVGRFGSTLQIDIWKSNDDDWFGFLEVVGLPFSASVILGTSLGDLVDQFERLTYRMQGEVIDRFRDKILDGEM